MKKLSQALFFYRQSNWIKNGSSSILDQGLFSGTNFLLNVLLARWLLPEQYGTFALSFIVYLFLSGFQNAFILEPMTIFGASKYLDIKKSYLFANIKLHFLFTGFISLVITCGGIILKAINILEDFSVAIIAIGISLPFMLLIWLSRRSFYIVNNPTGAVVGSTIYMIIVVFGSLVIYSLGLKSSLTFWYLLLAFSGFTGAILSWKLSWMDWKKKDYFKIDVKSIFLENWHYGKWIVPANILFHIGNQSQIFISAVLLGLDAAGAWRALQNFTLPIQQVLTAIAILGLPALAAEFGKGNFASLRRKGLLLTLILALFASGYAALLFVFAPVLEKLLYAGRFSNYVQLIPLIGISPILIAIETGFGLMLRALQRNRYYLISTGVAAFTGVILSIVYIKLWGLFGAVESVLFTGLIAFCATIWMYLNWFPKVRRYYGIKK